jgi:predicted DNA-binding protein
MKNKTILVRVPEQLEERLKAAAMQTGMTLSEYIRFLLQSTCY